jgi:tRNA-2-methylthio-N6-dimethylallyladenosine synthase
MIEYCGPSEAREPAEHPQNPGGRLVYLETFGCQMNELDSELVTGQLRSLGYGFTRDAEAADIVLYNTCSVREQAENKALSRIGIIGQAKQDGRALVLGVLGCMAEREGAAMMRKYPQIDLMCGPGELDRLPMLIDNAFKTGAVEAADRIALQGSRTRRSSTLSAAEDNLELLDLSRSFDPDRHGDSAIARRSAYVRITRGCNKFCTYCVVPYTRGPEVHRPPDAIVEECRKLADSGAIEITLLGQTVNHYRYTHGSAVTVHGSETAQIGPGLGAFRNGSITPASRRVTTFADLLQRIHDDVPSIERLRFVTSYPRDFTEDALRVIAGCPRICPYLHVPAQSGSNRILKLMNRGYTVEEYIEFIDRAVAIVPDVSIAGDIIVGFPTETEDDFEATRALLRRVPFKNNFIFKYSPRPGTTAIDRFADDVPVAVKRRRNNELLELQARVSAGVHQQWVGCVVRVLVERISRQSTARHGRVELGWARPSVQMSGRTAGDLIVVFDLPSNSEPEHFLGRLVEVRITGSGPLLLRGDLVAEPAGLVPRRSSNRVERRSGLVFGP